MKQINSLSIIPDKNNYMNLFDKVNFDFSYSQNFASIKLAHNKYKY